MEQVAQYDYQIKYQNGVKNVVDEDKSSSSGEDEIELELEEEQKKNQNNIIQTTEGVASFIEVHEYLDYKENKKWITVEVLEIKGNDLLIFNAQVMPPKWVPFNYMTLRKQWITGVQIQESYRIDVNNKYQGWMEATVIAVAEQKILIHYTGYKQQYDEWVLINSNFVAPLGYGSKTFGIGRILKLYPQLQNKLIHKFMIYLQIWNLFKIRQNYEKIEKSLPVLLHEKGLVIKEVEPDGNCMFRAISDQLYGTEVFHYELRKYALQYVLYEREFFKEFILNGDVDKYISYKMKDGVWGDNIELQAFRELFDIPIEIYMYSNEPMKTGLEINQNKQEPVRLSYHGKCHYNSVKPIHAVTRSLLQEKFGVREELGFKKLKERKSQEEQTKSNSISVNETRAQQLLNNNNLELIFNESKKIFEELQNKNEQQAIVESMEQEDEDQLLDFVIKQSAQELPQQQDIDIEQQILKKIIEESKQNEELQQDKQLQKILEESELEKAIKESQQGIRITKQLNMRKKIQKNNFITTL